MLRTPGSALKLGDSISQSGPRTAISHFWGPQWYSHSVHKVGCLSPSLADFLSLAFFFALAVIMLALSEDPSLSLSLLVMAQRSLRKSETGGGQGCAQPLTSESYPIPPSSSSHSQASQPLFLGGCSILTPVSSPRLFSFSWNLHICAFL